MIIGAPQQQWTHPDYDRWLPWWTRCRDVIAGDPKIKSPSKRKRYLPPLKSHENSPEKYDRYVQGALFYGATKRTKKAYEGMIFRKDPQIELPSAMEIYRPQILKALRMCVSETINTNRIGVLDEYPVSGQELTLAQLESSDLRPYKSIYKAESIINWEEIIDNDLQSSAKKIVLRYYKRVEDLNNEFYYKDICYTKVLDLDENGHYRQRLYETSSELNNQLISEIVPVINGSPLDYIPFHFCDSNGGNVEVQEPELLDLVAVNLSHYLTSATLENGEFWAGTPTPVIASDIPPDHSKMLIGPDGLIPLSSGSSWGYLEFSGAGLGSLRESLKDKEQMMAKLGARLLEGEKRAAEAAETARIHRAGEYSILANIANSVSDTIEKSERTRAEWLGQNPDDVSIQLNTDFMPGILAGQELIAIVQGWQSGAYSYETLYENLQRGEIIRQDKPIQEEIEAIESQNASTNVLNFGGNDGM